MTTMQSASATCLPEDAVGERGAGARTLPLPSRDWRPTSLLFNQLGLLIGQLRHHLSSCLSLRLLLSFAGGTDPSICCICLGQFARNSNSEWEPELDWLLVAKACPPTTAVSNDETGWTRQSSRNDVGNIYPEKARIFLIGQK